MTPSYSCLRQIRAACVLLAPLAQWNDAPRARADGEPLAEARRAADRFELADRTLERWIEHIRPTETELAWENIGWLPTFSEGLVRADAIQRPVLLWVMNGHPLGCT